MKTNIRGAKIDVTDSIKNYIETKIAKLDKYFENSNEIEANIIIRVRNVEDIIEVTILTKKYTLRAEESNEDLYAAVDLVVDKLERQIRKNKTKLIDKYRKEPIVEFNFNYEVEDEKEDVSKIVKRKIIDSKPMSEEEAILQMNLLNHDFFIFSNVDEECYSVLYKRKDGDYGIINTK